MIFGRQPPVSMLLILLGVGAMSVAVGADLIGVGGKSGLGQKQLLLLLAGALVLLVGVALAVPVPAWLRAFWLRNAVADERQVSPFVAAFFFGLVFGFLDVASRMVRQLLTAEPLRPVVGPYFIWMAPLSYLLIFAVVAAVLFALARLWPRMGAVQPVTFVFAFLGFSSLALQLIWIERYAAFMLAAGLAYQVSRLAAQHQGSFRGLIACATGWPALLMPRRGARQPGAAQPAPLATRRHFLVGTVSTIGGLAVGVSGWQHAQEFRATAMLPRIGRDLPNILFLVLDTVRAQSLSLYGRTRPTTPNLERLARKGVVFDQALSTTSWTLPSHGSMFTGRLPYEMSGSWRNPLDDRFPTLAEMLGASGYRTGGFVGNLLYCTREFGLSRGFQHYADIAMKPGQIIDSSGAGREITNNAFVRGLSGYHELLNRKNAPTVNEEFLSWRSGLDRRPYFAFINYYDAHEPYFPPSPFSEAFQVGERDIELTYDPNWGPRGMARWKLTHAEAQSELAAYEACIAYLDDQIGRLLDIIAREGEADNTLVVITSDHGEEFGEHGLFSHGGTLYLPGLHVPLILSLPAAFPAGTRVSDAVSLRDLPATILEVLGLQAQFDVPGESLARFWREDRPSARASGPPVFSELEKFSREGYPASLPLAAANGRMTCLVDNRFQFIANVDGRAELYDYRDDPLQQHDLSASPAAAQTMMSFKMWLSKLDGGRGASS